MFCLELNKEFETLNELHLALKRNEKKLISLKTSQIYKSADKNQLSIIGSYLKADKQIKNAIGLKENYIYAVINTTKYMDSHMDVHFNGIWNKSLKEQQGNIYYVDNHSFKVDDVIAWKEDVRAFTKLIQWSLVGKNYEGETQALIYEISKDKLVKQTAIDAITEKRDVENSVCMQYVKIKLAVDSDDSDMKENKEYFEKKYSEIANKDKVDEMGYFWGIEEAKIIREGSMVLSGSNDATNIIQLNEPSNDTHKDNEPQHSTQLTDLLKNLI